MTLLENTPDFFAAFNTLCYERAMSKGFWEDPNRNEAELIALMHSELSEALEGLRHGDPKSDKIPEFSQVEEELADTVIRIADMCGKKNLRLGEAIVAKLAYNEGRPFKHNKHF